MYLLGMSSHIFNFTFKTPQYPWMKVLINEKNFPYELICCSSITGSKDILKFKRKHDFARLNFSWLRNFKKWRKNVYFRVSKIVFQLDILQYHKNHLTKIVHCPHYGIIIESSKWSENKNGQNCRNPGHWEATFPNYCNASKTLKQVLTPHSDGF